MTEEVIDARYELFRAFVRLIEASWTDPRGIRDAEILEAADALDDACGALVDALRESRRHDSAADAVDPPARGART